MKKLFILSLLSTIFLITCSKKPKIPKLVVFIVIDQSTPSIINKYKHLFIGGYSWLFEHGIQFQNAFHDHGMTTTAPGHYAISTGIHPGKGGIIGNEWFDRDLKRGWYCVEDSLSINFTDNSDGRSFRNINSLTVGDWLKNKQSDSKVISISGKDRSAILLGGKNPDISIWYDKKGQYTTSSYYSSELPNWLKDYNDQLDVHSYLDTVWVPIYDNETYSSNARADYYPGEEDWEKKSEYSPTFPISFSAMGKKSLLKNFYTTPFGDRSILELAELSIQEYELGKDDIPDILFLGLSATDGVGHDNGPHSFEQLDNHLRLDKYLGDFINSQEDKLGKGNILYILSSDHGVLDLPEYLSEQGIDSGRISRAVRDSIFSITMKKIRSQIGKGKIYRYENFFYFDHSMNGVERKVATEILKEQLINIPGVDSVVTKYELLKDGKDNISRRLKNMVHINKSPDIYLILKKYWTWTSKRGTSHGSPYDYDTHIPLIFSGGNKISKIRSDYIRSVDIAPTLARILEINYPKDIDGKPFLIK